MAAALSDPDPVVLAPPAHVKAGGPNGGGPHDFDRGGDRGDDDDDHDADRARTQSAGGAGRLAMQFVLLSISVLFITVVVVYFLRSRTPIRWNPVGVPGFLWLSSALILASSGTLEAARRAFARLQVRRYARWVLFTFFLGLAFLISQLLSLRQLIGQGIYLRHNPHSSLFYVVTGAHGVHLLGGMIALAYLIVRASLATGDVRALVDRQRTLMSVSTLYWHFLTGLWVALFTLLMMWR